MLTKKGDRMAYLTLEDLLGVVEVIVFPDLYKNAGDLIVPERLVRITGTVDREIRARRFEGARSSRSRRCKRRRSSGSSFD